MNTDEDILFLYMTSHGSAEHEVSIKLDGINLPPMSAEDLAQSLQDSAIRWKIVVVSACYSGGFIPLLESEDTLVMAAARADRRSFGCSEDSDMTYFGRAYFEQALAQANSFEDSAGRPDLLSKEKRKNTLTNNTLNHKSLWAKISVSTWPSGGPWPLTHKTLPPSDIAF